MNDGKMTEARDQGLMTLRSLRLFISSIRPRSRGSMNGPFLIERDMPGGPLLPVSRADDQSPGRLRPAGPIAHRRLAPRGLGRHPRRGLALAAAVRMVTRVHDDASDLGPLAHVPGATGLAEVLVLVVEVADLANGGHALDAHPANLA